MESGPGRFRDLQPPGHQPPPTSRLSPADCPPLSTPGLSSSRGTPDSAPPPCLSGQDSRSLPGMEVFHAQALPSSQASFLACRLTGSLQLQTHRLQLGSLFRLRSRWWHSLLPLPLLSVARKVPGKELASQKTCKDTSQCSVAEEDMVASRLWLCASGQGGCLLCAADLLPRRAAALRERLAQSGAPQSPFFPVTPLASSRWDSGSILQAPALLTWESDEARVLRA